MARIIVTGAAGFIGYHVARRLLERGESVVGIDNLNDYYDISLKQSRLKELQNFPRFEFEKLDIAAAAGLLRAVSDAAPAIVIHLAAQAGVRYSIAHPHAYASSNLVG